jgi:hypothetical protein
MTVAPAQRHPMRFRPGLLADRATTRRRFAASQPGKRAWLRIAGGVELVKGDPSFSSIFLPKLHSAPCHLSRTLSVGMGKVMATAEVATACRSPKSTAYRRVERRLEELDDDRV